MGMKTLLITGGAGYIGSHMVKLLSSQGYFPVILDNVSTGHREAVTTGEFVEGDIADAELLAGLCQRYRFDGVMHFASSILVGESMQNPAHYYTNNLQKSIALLNGVVEHGIASFIFSSTAAIFGEPAYTPIDEAHPKNPVNVYGRTKYIFEQVMQDYARAYGVKIGALRYFNAAGADPGGELGECHTPETHLIPLLLQVARGQKSAIDVFGNDYATMDGTCIRDYVHVTDLCQAHLQLFSYLEQGGEEWDFNLGTGRGYSVYEVVKEVENVTGKKVPVNIKPRREGDPAILVADGTKAKDILCWQPERSDITTIIGDAWRWESGK